MATFTLDTSGEVWVQRGPKPAMAYTWSDLSPIVQGYVEALISTGVECGNINRMSVAAAPLVKCVGFSDLDPAALALILRDCERRAAQHQPDITRAIVGKMFWNHRRHGVLGAEYPPLTVYLSEAGKVCLREAA